MTSTDTIDIPDFIVPFCKEEPDILYSDNDLLLVAKPSGLLSVPGRHPMNRDCLITRLQQQWPTATIVHRLDMDTSGIMVIALNAEAHRELSRQFQLRQTSKRYEAIVDGLIAEDEGTIDLPLITDWPNRPRQKVCFESGKPSQTHFKVLSRDTITGFTHIELEPITGRSHQLRVHLSECGHPILGDKFYAHELAKKSSPRLLLHATRLALTHPISGEPVIGESPCTFSQWL